MYNRTELWLRHDSVVLGAVLSADDRRVLTWSEDNTARLWDTHTGKPLSEPLRHQGTVLGAVLGKTDESYVLTWSADFTARLWNAESGLPRTKPLSHQNQVLGARFSADEHVVLTWSSDKTARLWDAKNGKPLAQPFHHQHWVIGAVFSQDETRVLTWSYDNTARLWDAKNGNPLAQPFQHKGPVYGAVFSQDETSILTWSSDKTARLWDAKKRQPSRSTFPAQGAGITARYSARTRHASSPGAETTPRGSGMQKNGNPLAQPFQHKGSVTGAVFSQDETRVLTWSDDNTARLWELPTDPWPRSALVLRAEVETGTRLSDAGTLELILYDEWRSLWREYNALRVKYDEQHPCHRTPAPRPH